METQILQVVAVLGVMSGAAISTFRGWWNTPDTEKYSFKKLSGSLILAAVQAPMAVGIGTVLAAVGGDTSIIYVLFTTMTQGFTIDQLHTATKN